MTQLIDAELRERLLSSIAGDSLIILCGAGLSMAAPSKVSSAWHVAQHCASTYRKNTGSDLPETITDDIEAIAEHFFGRHELQNVFLRQLIDWSEFVSRCENRGHIAVADLLGAQLVDLVVSTNVDMLIEQAAKRLGEKDFYPVVIQDELNLNKDGHAPLVKLHGCATRTRFETVWCKSQLDVEPLKSRIEQLAAWLRGHLPNRDLLVVGFWTDWAYLNAILEAAVVSTEPRSVIVVDPSSEDALESKSPALWKWTQENARFQHVSASGDQFLDELRHVISCHFINRVWEKGKQTYIELFGYEPATTPSVDLDSFSTDQLYALRRDITGVPSTDIVRGTTIEDAHSLIGLLQLGLLLCGATLSSNEFTWNGTSVRLLHTPNESLSHVRNRFSVEPPNPKPPTRTVCIGAWDDGGVPQTIIQRGISQGIIRNTPDNSWESHERLFNQIKEELST